MIDIDSNTPASWDCQILIIYIPLQGMLLQVIYEGCPRKS